MTKRHWTGSLDFGVPVRTAETALKRAGIDWDVEATDLQEMTGREGGERFVVATRSTDGRIIGVNGTRHRVIQNSEMAELADVVLQMNDSFKIVGGGAFPNLDKTFLVLRSDHVLNFGEGDDTGFSSILLANDFNGNSPLQAIGFVGRLSCTNQMSGLTRRKTGHRLVSVGHTKSKDWKMIAAKDTLRAIVHEMDEVETEIQRLLEIEMTPDQATNVAVGSCPEEKIGDEGQVTNQRSINDWERRRETFRSELYAPWNEHLSKTALGAVLAAQGIDEHLTKSLDRDVSRVNRVIDANFPTMNRVLAAVG